MMSKTNSTEKGNHVIRQLYQYLVLINLFIFCSFAEKIKDFGDPLQEHPQVSVQDLLSHQQSSAEPLQMHDPTILISSLYVSMAVYSRLFKYSNADLKMLIQSCIFYHMSRVREHC